MIRICCFWLLRFKRSHVVCIGDPKYSVWGQTGHADHDVNDRYCNGHRAGWCIKFSTKLAQHSVSRLTIKKNIFKILISFLVKYWSRRWNGSAELSRNSKCKYCVSFNQELCVLVVLIPHNYHIVFIVKHLIWHSNIQNIFVLCFFLQCSHTQGLQFNGKYHRGTFGFI